MADQANPSAPAGQFEPPHPGVRVMPRWNAGDLIPAPVFTWRNWFALLGPGLVMGGAAIGGGEWLTGPALTARYGGALLWLATLSIIAQVFYNIEISRYTLYTGEPIFTGKFRIFPGPLAWLFLYVLLDFGSLFPYLAANAATPLAALWLRRIPGDEDRALLKGLGYAIFLVGMIPMVFGGKIYNTLKWVMTAKIVVVLGFLTLLAVFHTEPASWQEIFGGLFRFGTVPVVRGEDRNGNGVLDPGEDWDGDGRLDAAERRLTPTVDADGDGKPEAWKDIDGDDVPDKFIDEDHDGIRDGDNVENVFLALWRGESPPIVDFSSAALIFTFAAIAGSGGLTNTPISNYTRDQGWGMGYHVGAIPSVIGGQHIALSHVGMVFPVTDDSLRRWRGWVRHVVRDQACLWMPACFVGIALPSMLSVQFLRRGTEAGDWTAAGMTADGVASHVGQNWGAVWGSAAWYMTLLCGFMVLGPSVAITADGFIRRWVDVSWTSSRRLRAWEPHRIRYLYFGVLVAFASVGMVALWWGKPLDLAKIAGNFYNLALGVSCFHTLLVNRLLLPRELRAGWFITTGLFFSGLFFSMLGVFTALKFIMGW